MHSLEGIEKTIKGLFPKPPIPITFTELNFENEIVQMVNYSKECAIKGNDWTYFLKQLHHTIISRYLPHRENRRYWGKTLSSSF